jgi:PPP family 3-phenylpropionic acid transporter
MVIFSFFWNAALPQFEATTFNHLRDETHRYSSIRLWGSVGFIVAVWGLGYFLEGEHIRYLPVLLIVLFSGIWFSSLIVPEEAAGHLPLDHEPLRKVLTKPHVAGLLLVCFLMQASHGPYYTFYSIYMESFNYSLSFIGLLWALGVMAEVGVFLVMHRLVPIFGLRKLLLYSLMLTIVRWALIGKFPETIAIVLFAQVLHAATFGIYHAVAIQLIHDYFTGKHQGKGQALYSSMSFGAGGALGSFLSGYTYDYFGPSTMFYGAAVVSLISLVIALKTIRTSD